MVEIVEVVSEVASAMGYFSRNQKQYFQDY